MAYRVTYTRFTSKGLLRTYDATTCQDTESIKDYLKGQCSDIYDKEAWETQIVKRGNGWVRIAMNLKEERILVNVAETGQ